eukprot:1970539-Prymnesium_polylepis.1
MTREFVRDLSFLAEHIMMADVTPDCFTRFDEDAPDAVEKLRLLFRCREQAPSWAPDKVGDLVMKADRDKASCDVRRRRAQWHIDFKRRYRPEVVEWIDTGHKQEKPAWCAAARNAWPSCAWHPCCASAAARNARPVCAWHPCCASAADGRKRPIWQSQPIDLGAALALCDSVLLLWPHADGPPLITLAFRGSKTYQDYFVTDASPRFVPLPDGHFLDADFPAAAFW